MAHCACSSTPQQLLRTRACGFLSVEFVPLEAAIPPPPHPIHSADFLRTPTMLPERMDKWHTHALTPRPCTALARSSTLVQRDCAGLLWRFLSPFSRVSWPERYPLSPQTRWKGGGRIKLGSAGPIQKSSIFRFSAALFSLCKWSVSSYSAVTIAPICSAAPLGWSGSGQQATGDV